MFSIFGFSALLFSGLFGFFAVFFADRIIANYPGTWADVFCGKTQKKEEEKRKKENGLLIRIITSSILLLTSYFLLHLPSSILLLTSSFLFTLAVLTDIKARLIPDILTFPLMLIGAAVANDLPWIAGGLNEALITAATGYVLASVMGMLYYKKSDMAIGGGDIKLIAVGGLFLGATGLPIALVISAVSAYLYIKIPHFFHLTSSILHKSDRTQFVPLAPFFIIGSLIYLISWMAF